MIGELTNRSIKQLRSDHLCKSMNILIRMRAISTELK